MSTHPSIMDLPSSSRPVDPGETERASQRTPVCSSSLDAEVNEHPQTLSTSISISNQDPSPSSTTAISREPQDLTPLESSSSSPTQASQVHISPGATHGRDYLNSVPPEILIKILVEVPLSSFLDLVHTCSALHAFIKSNAARICNMAIQSRFAFEAKLLCVTKDVAAFQDNKEGWLIPQAGKLREAETLAVHQHNSKSMWWQQCLKPTCLHGYRMDNKSACTGILGCGESSHERRCIDKRSHYSLLGTNWWAISSYTTPFENFMSFRIPGPHFLHFLESVPLWASGIRSDDGFPPGTYYSHTDHEGKTKYFRYCNLDVSEFLRRFNFREVDVKGRKVAWAGQGFPKGLLWYFGTDKLVFDEESVAYSDEEESDGDGSGDEEENGGDDERKKKRG